MIHFPCNLLLLLFFCNYFGVRISPVFKSMKSFIFLSVLNIILIVGLLLWSWNAKEIYLAHRIHHIHMCQNSHFGLLNTSTNIRDYARHDCSWRNLSTIPDFLLDAYYISSMIFWATSCKLTRRLFHRSVARDSYKFIQPQNQCCNNRIS